MNAGVGRRDKYTPGGLLASSTQLGWHNVRVEIRHHAGGEIANRAVQAETEVAIDLFGHTESVVTRRSGRTSEVTRSERGMIWMCPSGVVEDVIHLSSPMTRQLHMFLPARLFSAEALGDRLGRFSPADLRYATGFHDPLVAGIGQGVAQELLAPTWLGSFLIETLSVALAARILQRHAPTAREQPRTGRGLSAVQERRAKELMDANLNTTLPEIAATCQLSVTHFVRAFRQSTGISPHQWLLKRRVEKAMLLLSYTSQPIAQIALLCGFSSQSHLTRAFTTQIGVPPAQWRRSRE